MDNLRILKRPRLVAQDLLLAVAIRSEEQERLERERAILAQERSRILKRAQERLAEAESRLHQARSEAEEIVRAAESKSCERQQQAEEAYQQLLEQAKTESETLKRKAAEQGAEQGKREGYQVGLKQGQEEGHRQGYEAGLAEGREQFQAQIENARSFAAQITEQRHQAFLDMEPQVVELAFSIASKIIHTSIRQGETIRHVVRDILDTVATSEKLRFNVHPQDLAHLQDDPTLFERFSVEIVPDETIQPGGCVVTTPHGYVDARIDKHLARIQEILEAD